MSDKVFPFRSASVGRRRRRPSRTDAFTVRLVGRAVMLPLLLLAVVLGAVFAVWSVFTVALGWLLVALACGLTGVAVTAAVQVRSAARAVLAVSAEELTAVVGAVGAVERSVRWSADELCRGARPPMPDGQIPQPEGRASEVHRALGALQARAVAALIRVHDESDSAVLLEVLRRLAVREHALVSRALEAVSQLETLTDEPELLAKIFEIDHLVTRMRRQVESTAVLGGQSLRSVRRPVPVRTVLGGAVSEVVQYPRVVVAAGSVGVELGLPGHVGPDLTHLLAELIENATECSDPATTVTVRAERVPNGGLAVEVEDRAVPMPPHMRSEMNRLLKAPDDVDLRGQVRAGQLGLLVAATIAQSHGLSIRLQEAATGGTTALVVIPARLLVALPPADDADSRQDARLSPRSAPQHVAAAATAPAAGQLARPLAPAAGGDGQAGGPDAAPRLPRRKRSAGGFLPPHEREPVPATAATPGLAAAFRDGIHAGQALGSPPASPEQPRP
ncbi:sensor histidine-kinase [Streptomyces albus]|uniref:histidine kinase n=1 Tax=Streptomyces albus (strain ATCC 21838 / DSM 41398 / FERM P-419 / JCM 4703 / NBRC 107858) TaxID=1081613 RepID=A0A0B5EXF8_STRA4|nr:sensor histidine-kinase [Streptomyces albus]AOU81807.1 sensor histidine-kinase [Streptomyces albus]AYN37494.1 sensor histidine-kinase [Streptomyces albus]